ncbi:hypothetical protein C0J50_21417 [Silurus asotus]|uniref:Uncharacterized protein n=1 Tax=Silurus asotus TaxID=30991 RepID=A0AAD5ALQ8_SILAS|nr:hypothetical protein C0J50_21417 [Silurus asotus]
MRGEVKRGRYGIVESERNRRYGTYYKTNNPFTRYLASNTFNNERGMRVNEELIQKQGGVMMSPRLALSWLYVDEDEDQDTSYDEKEHNLQPQRNEVSRTRIRCPLLRPPLCPLLRPPLCPLLRHCCVFPL